MSPADAAAATILRELLAGRMSTATARAKWPTEPLSQPSAVTYLDYFDEGLDGRGTREPAIDRVVANLASLLEAERATWSETTESWHSEEGPVDTPRPAAEVMRRAIGASLAFTRGRLELDVAKLVLDFKDAERALQQLLETGVGVDELEAEERSLWEAKLGAVAPGLALRAVQRVEAVGVLRWALGQVRKFPAKPFDPKRLAELMPRTADAAAGAIREATLRPTAELLEARAAARQDVEARTATSGSFPNEELLRAQERLRALVWLFTPSAPSLGETRLL